MPSGCADRIGDGAFGTPALRARGESGDIEKTQVAQRRVAGPEVIAEGNEDFDQLSALQAMGCHFGQGYYFARPYESRQIDVMLAAGVGPLPTP